MSEDELKILQKFYTQLAVLAKKESSLQQSHSIDEAKTHHARKHSRTKGKVKE